MSPIEKSILERKLANIIKEINFLSRFDKNHLTSSTDIVQQYAVLHSLQNALSACIDIAQHIVSEELGIVPDTYADAIFKLAEANFLDQNFAKNFSEAIRFRNKLVHTYEEINFLKVANDLQKMIDDLKYFSKAIGGKI